MHDELTIPQGFALSFSLIHKTPLAFPSGAVYPVFHDDVLLNAVFPDFTVSRDSLYFTLSGTFFFPAAPSVH